MFPARARWDDGSSSLDVVHHDEVAAPEPGHQALVDEPKGDLAVDGPAMGHEQRPAPEPGVSRSTAMKVFSSAEDPRE
jgi:hypothetical protein